MHNKTCRDCDHFMKRNGWGLCLRFPPNNLVVSEDGHVQVDGDAPSCGEFKKKPDANGTE